MTPQLQQAIRLLQLSSIELQTEIQEALETNPLLEVEENVDFDANQNNQDEGDGSQDVPIEDSTKLEHNDIPEELPTDSQWEDTFDHQHVGPATKSQVVDNDMQRDNEDESSQSLQEHLLWQMRLTPFTELEQAIATLIIDAIEEDGYFKSTPEDIQQSLGQEDDIDLQEIEAVLHRIQHFDPIGVGARDLRECLLIQLQQFDNETEHLDLLTTLIDQHLDTLAKRDYQLIKRAQIGRAHV